MPVCSNCGGGDFVWADNLKTGSIGRGTLSLRSGGELAIGTRVCRGCGHADLFVKDPTVLRQPHTWKPGEFVAIPPRPPAGPRPTGPSIPAPAAPSPVPTPPTPAVAPSSIPASEPTSSTPPAPAESVPAAAAAEPATAAPEAETETKKPARRKSAKAKSGGPPLVQQ